MPCSIPLRFLILAGFLFTGIACAEPRAPADTASEDIDPTATVENGFYDALSRGQASEARTILEGALNDRVSTSLVNVPQLMLALANFLCDAGDLVAAKPWYERLDTEFGSQIADEESQKTFHELISAKLDWIRAGGKRPWARPDPKELGREIAAALTATDTSRLSSLLAGIDVYVGWWQSELETTAREDLLAFLAKHRGAATTWSNEAEVASRAAAPDENVIYLNTHGWTEMEGGFTNVQFALHRVPGGWEWRGIVLGETREP
ncbi:MAG TPA: hypothetical protein VIV61_00915 [Candidatus Ozemobacteraceae bacterium]